MSNTKKSEKTKRPVKNKDIKVILLNDVSRLGQRGELKAVKPGFYKYLAGAGKVAAVTKKNIRQIEDLKLVALKRAEKSKTLAEVQKTKIEGLLLRIAIKTGEHGEIYSSITKNDIKNFLRKEGIKVDKNQIELEHSIREICEKNINIHLGYDIVANLKIITMPER